jgi:hypothetical protein
MLLFALEAAEVTTRPLSPPKGNGGPDRRPIPPMVGTVFYCPDAAENLQDRQGLFWLRFWPTLEF